MRPSDRDHIDELVRAANPVDPARQADGAESTPAQALMQRIVTTPRAVAPPVAGPRRAPRLRFALASLAAVAVAGAGVSYAVSNSGGVHRATVGCYASAKVDASAAVLAGGGGDPVAACQQAWSDGRIPGQPPTPAPELRACVLPEQNVGVFPLGTDPCQVLGLEPLASASPTTSTAPESTSTTPSTPVNPIGAMTESVSNALSASCLDEATAKSVVRSALIQAGLTAWTVETMAPFTAERPCASPGFDEVNHVVRLIPNSQP